MKRISTERKATILAKLLPPYNMTVAAVAQMDGISEATLYNWRNKAKSEGKPVPGADKNTEQWPAEARFAAIVERRYAHLAPNHLSEHARQIDVILEGNDTITTQGGNQCSAARNFAQTCD